VATIAGIAFCALSGTSPSVAQISADTNLPDGQTVVTPGTTPGIDFLVTGGTKVGNNLFHSFQNFSVPENGSAIFQNDANLTNIINRVTGDLESNINGLIQTNGSANFFLINPNGIIFGPNASLNIGGSFITSTASSLKLSNGDEFSTINPTKPLLTISVPLGLQFGNQAKSITNQSQFNDSDTVLNSVGAPGGLVLKPFQTLAFVGGEIKGELGNITVSGGRIELGAVGENSFVGLNQDSQGFTLDYANVENFGDIELNRSFGDVSGPGGGNIQLQGQKINLERSALFAVTFPNGIENGGGIHLHGDEVNINSSGIQAITLGNLQGADVALEAENISIQAESVVSAETRGSGQGGKLTISTDNLDVVNSILGTETKISGNAGDVLITTQDLSVRDGAQIATNAFEEGASGKLTVTASNSIELIGESNDASIPSGLFSDNHSSKKSAGVSIETGTLNIRDGARISASTFAGGDGGQVTIQAKDSQLTASSQTGESSGIFNNVEAGATGQGGNISFTTERLQIYEGAQISASTFSSGNAGRVSITASDSIEIQDLGSDTAFSGLFAQVEARDTSQATGKGGDILLETGQLTLQGKQARISASTDDVGWGGNVTINVDELLVGDGAQIQAATTGVAPSGKLEVTATTKIELSGVNEVASGLFTSTQGDADAGNLDVNTGDLSILDGARISASSFGAGMGGTINVNASDTVKLTGTGISSNTEVRSGLFVEATGTGKAGNIEVNTDSLLLDNRGAIIAETASDDGGDISLKIADMIQMRNNSLISATAGANSKGGDGGNIDIATNFLIAVPSENSDITANAFEGQGGNIQISARNIFGIEFRENLTPLSDITVSSNFGANGIVEITTPEIDPSQGITELPEQMTDTSNQIARGCGVDRGQIAKGKTRNRFVVIGKGGLPSNPEAILSSNTILEDLETTPILKPQDTPQQAFSSTKNPIKVSDSTDSLVEAQSIVVNSQGEILLTAQVPRDNQNNSWFPSMSCNSN
ncbi:filamentous hemagglutinin N-terminal domain-containing protein, partial [Mastigocoleus sp. MO_188.B34]|uniref:two-partner secretion domain-containing protein n=1 Tax=Mastigocoleus sp. MO_188.B34 TaxID=3036635 RepID=UPI0026239663